MSGKHSSVKSSSTANISSLLRAEYSKRRARNQSYSLNTFAKHLGISSGTLSDILGNKRKIGMRVYERLVGKLGLPATVSTAAQDSNQSFIYRVLAEDEYRLISDWYHFAIVDLARTQGFRDSIPWIAKRLGITSTEVSAAIERLIRCELLCRKNGRLLATNKPFTTSCDVPSSAIREAAKQELDKASESIDSVDVELRDLSSISLTFAPERMQEAKTMIKEFRRKFAATFDQEGAQEVYLLGLQFFPYSKRVKE